jgi:hypothetical protein
MEDLSKIYFGEFKMLDINGSACYLTRTGYTLPIVYYFISFILSLHYLCYTFLYLLQFSTVGFLLAFFLLQLKVNLVGILYVPLDIHILQKSLVIHTCIL